MKALHFSSQCLERNCEGDFNKETSRFVSNTTFKYNFFSLGKKKLPCSAGGKEITLNKGFDSIIFRKGNYFLLMI